MVIVKMFFSFLFMSILLVSFMNAQQNCVEPPMECPNVNITFWLYTRQNKDDPHQVTVNDSNSITSAPWVKGAPIKILIHGYTGHKDFSPNTQIRPEYLKCCNYNIISVDYNPIAREPCYIAAARNTELVGMCTAQLIDTLINKYGFDLSRFHVIGFSLGGQTAGFIGNYVMSGKLDRITALDPALPLFVTEDSKKKIDLSDAKFVDVLHTNALEKGKLELSGHVDIFFNGGFSQPGCHDTKEQTTSGCNHERAPIYYAESITTNIGFYGSPCYSWIMYMIGWCEISNSTEEVLVGEYIKNTFSGTKMYQATCEELHHKPFSVGEAGSYTSRDTLIQNKVHDYETRRRLELDYKHDEIKANIIYNMVAMCLHDFCRTNWPHKPHASLRQT